MIEKLTPIYSESKALIIGINEYEEVSPLKFAVSDAEAFVKLLIDEFSFKEDLDSSRKCNRLISEEYLIRCLEIKAFSRT